MIQWRWIFIAERNSTEQNPVSQNIRTQNVIRILAKLIPKRPDWTLFWFEQQPITKYLMNKRAMLHGKYKRDIFWSKFFLKIALYFGRLDRFWYRWEDLVNLVFVNNIYSKASVYQKPILRRGKEQNFIFLSTTLDLSNG